jgi:group I intron endonuclease
MSQLMKGKRPIDLALLKYGYSNFRLEILEYCEKKETVSREQYYFDLFEPEYNILKLAGSTLGFKHSQDTLNHMKTHHLVDDELRKKRSLARLGVKASDYTRAKLSAATTALIGIPVIVKNINTNEETEYVNLTEAGKALGVSRTAIKKALDLEKVLKKTYYIRKK